MIKLALRSALSDRAADDKVRIVVERWDFEAPSTKQAKAALEALDVDGRVLVVLGREDEAPAKSFRNLPEVHTLGRRPAQHLRRAGQRLRRVLAAQPPGRTVR